MSNSDDLIFLFRQLSLLLDAGIPLISCMELLCQHQTKVKTLDVIHHLILELSSGKTLDDCMKKKVHVFDSFTCRLAQIGEQTGKLSDMFSLIADTKENHMTVRKKIKQALVYPCFIIVTSSIVVFCLLFFVMPKFSDLFHDKSNALPLLTRLLFYLSFILHKYFVILLLFIIFTLLITLLPFSFFKKIRNTVIDILCRLPVIKSIIYKIEISRYARQIGILFRAGIDLLSILQVLAESAENSQLSLTEQLYHNTNKGLSFHQAMLMTQYFPLIMIQMVKVGEETGKLDLMLEHAAILFETEVEQYLRQFISILEPLIMIILGVLIGGIVIGMYLPLFKLGNFLT